LWGEGFWREKKKKLRGKKGKGPNSATTPGGLEDSRVDTIPKLGSSKGPRQNDLGPGGWWHGKGGHCN